MVRDKGQLGTPRMSGRSVDGLLAIGLFLLAVGVYSRQFLHVPALSETRDFLLQRDLTVHLWHVIIPTGSVYRPLSWAFFGWQQEVFPYQEEVFNLIQFGLIGLGAFLGFLHLRQLRVARTAALVACIWWCLSLPVYEAAFWQATQHDKLAFILVVLTLMIAFYAIRLDRLALAPLFTGLILAGVVLSESTKPTAFVLPVVLLLATLLFAPNKTIRGYLRASAIVLLPILCGTLYAIAFVVHLDPTFASHAMGGEVGNKLQRFAMNMTGRGENALPIALLIGPVLAGWSWASWRLAKFVARAFRSVPQSPSSPAFGRESVLVYLCGVFVGSIAILSRGQHVNAYYLLLPHFVLAASLVIVVGVLLRSRRAWIRYGSQLYTGIAAVTLLTSPNGVIHSEETYYGSWPQKASNVAKGYEILRDKIDPDRLERITFSFPHASPVTGDIPVDPQDYVFFFYDTVGLDNADYAGQTVPSFVFHKDLRIPIRSRFGEDSSGGSSGELNAFWSNEFELQKAIVSGVEIYVEPRDELDPG